MQVVAAESRRADLAAEFDDFQAIPAFAPADEMAAMHPLTLGTLDWRILDAVDGGRSVAAIAAALDEAPEDVAARVRALRGAAILVLQEAPTDVSRSARAAIEAGQYDRAVTLLRGRLATTPGDADAWHALGLAEVGAGRFERAIDAWDAWAAAAPARATEALALRQAARTMLEALQESRD